MKLDISCVLLTWNSDKYIEKCLDSLLQDLIDSRLSYEIFIVDNGSKDKTKKIINLFSSNADYNIIPIFLKTNRGTTYPRNIALKKAKGEYIAVIDSDVEISKGTISELVGTLRKNKNAGIVAPKLLYPSGTLQKSTDYFPTVFSKLYRYFFLKHIEKMENGMRHQGNICEVDYAISAMWILRGELISKVGLLDERIFYAPEDVDYCLRIWLSGYKVMYNPRAVVIHHTQELSRGLRMNRATFSHIKGLFYYFLKYRCLLRRPKIRIAD